MEYEKKNKDAISTIKQALRQLSTNGVPVGNIIKAIKDIEEKYAESEDERISGNIIATIHLYYGEPLEDEAKEMIAWLEKQGEQKIKTPEESLGIDSDTYNKIVDECIYGEQNTTDNVEPKFHKGEWIIHLGTENIYQVVASIDNQYQLKYGDNYTIQKCSVVDICARLWDIAKDAKDGDVLAWDDSKCIALFKNIYDEDSFNSYGFVGCCTGTFESRQSYHDIEGAHPATKEQRDHLFQKMHEAGYEWDSENKELIKIEHKPAWSEKDNEHVNSLLKRLDGLCRKEFTTTRFAINDDENWLKSLKDKYTWKPSEEQMKALKDALNDAIFQYNFKGSMIKEEVTRKHAETIESLYNDLKKL